MKEIQAAERDAVALAPERKVWMREELERLQALVPSLARTEGEEPREAAEDTMQA